MLSSHDKVMAPCLQANKLADIWPLEGCIESNSYENNLLTSAEVILINEGQFFPDLYEIVVDMLNKNKKVYICGLDGDFERKKFGFILDLIPLCDKVIKLTSLCSICKDGTPAIFSMRLTEEKEQTIVGSTNYIPVCRKCYNKNIVK
jgi:thymidine kinase